MSEPYVPERDPEPLAHHDPLPPRCPECGVLLRRVDLERFRCPEHGVVKPFYGDWLNLTGRPQ